ncbi:MAG: CAP domain-containing protein [Gammaproteobacteria bacterium]
MRALLLALTCCLIALLSQPATARGNLLDNINAVRANGCGGKRGGNVPLRSNRQLDAVARRVSRGERLRDALASSGYRALHSSMMFTSGARDNADIARLLGERACTELRSEDVREIGVETRGNSVWIVFAAPFEADALKNESRVSARILRLANEARARARRCGSRQFPAVPPLALESHLTSAAREHARDMARHDMLEHTGSDGSTPDQRVTSAGYKWRATGENIASGPTTPEEVMEGWLASPGHCENLMSPRFTEMGIAWVVDPKSAQGVYWAQVFGARRE